MTGNIYFIKCNKFIKIGYAKDVSKRLSQLQVGNPQELKLLAVIPGNKRIERYFHEALANWRVRGEWFLASNKTPVRKVVVLLNNGARPTKLKEIEILRDFSPRKGRGRGLGYVEVAGFRG